MWRSLGRNLLKNADVPLASRISNPVPTKLVVKEVDGQRVRLRWNGVGRAYRYNYYSGFPDQPRSYEKENNDPLAKTETVWRPYDRTKIYWTQLPRAYERSRRWEKTIVHTPPYLGDFLGLAEDFGKAGRIFGSL